MSGIAVAIGAGAVSSYIQYKSAEEAGKIQERGTERAIKEQQRQFDVVQELLKPYVESGTGALRMQEDFLGINGPEAQAKAIQSIQESPEFAALTKQGEEGILQSAAATGGLRGGNVQGALAQFRPQVLSKLIESQFSKLGTISSMGQAAAAGQAASAQQQGSDIADLLQQLSSAQAGAALGKGAAIGGAAGQIGNLALLKALKGF